MLNEKMVALGTQRSVIRELFEYGKQRAAEVGPENVLISPSEIQAFLLLIVSMKLL